MGAFLQHPVHGHGELLGHVRVRIVPTHDRLAIKEQGLGALLDRQNLRYGKAGDEKSAGHAGQ